MTDIDNYIDSNDRIRTYVITYYHDTSLWDEAPEDTKNAVINLTWSDYIKYLDNNGKRSKDLNLLPKDAGGLYLFFIQGTTIPAAEKYLVYVGRAYYTDKENIRKRVKRYLWESTAKQGRPKIARLFRLWKDHLYIRFCATTDNGLIEAGESALIRAILPPFNSTLPDRIEYKRPQKAFKEI